VRANRRMKLAVPDDARVANKQSRYGSANRQARSCRLCGRALAADPRYVTEQLMMKALRELRELDRRS
jgi:ribosomal protein S14